MPKPQVEFIKPRSPQKLGSKPPAIDPAALARAEAALKSLSGQFQEWMQEEVSRVEAAWREARARNLDDESLIELYGRAHDAKGMGSTYEYPLVTRLAGGLCRLLDTAETRAIAAKTPTLIGAHVDAMSAAVRDRIKSENSPVGKALVAELDGLVTAALAGVEDR